MTLLELNLFGGLSLQQNGTPLPELKSQKGKALLCYLAESGQEMARPFLATLLWSEMTDKQAARNLRKVLQRLKPLHEHLIITRETIAFNTDAAYILDVAAFEQGAAGHAIPQLQQALALFKGDFLEGFDLPDAPLFDEWLMAQRARLRELALTALHQLIAHFTEQSLAETAVTYARQLLTIEPWHEETHRQLMQLLALSGKRSEALAQYESCRRLLADKLGIQPTTATIQLYEQIKVEQLRPQAKKQLWGDIPGSRYFYGRAAECQQLQQWLIHEQCKLIAIWGMGGQGKTALAIQLTGAFRNEFDLIIWHSLINAPTLHTVLAYTMQIVAERPFSQLPQTLPQWTQLFSHFQQKRCLLILDNVETILQDGQNSGHYRPGFENYGDFITQFARRDHQSCLLLTGRERPRGFQKLERNHHHVHTLLLSGLPTIAAQQILAKHRLTSVDAFTRQLVVRYSGNPLALHLIAETIQEFYGGNLVSFLRDDAPIFADIRDVLDQQFGRLSSLEQEILFWLAIERETVSPDALWQNLINRGSKHTFLDALRALQRRSLLERAETGISLQNVVMEYVTERLVAAAMAELEKPQPPSQSPPIGGRGQIPLPPGGVREGGILNSHALLKAQAKDYVRTSQRRLILQPILQQLTAQFGAAGTEKRLHNWLRDLQQTPPATPGYAAGNLINLLVACGSDLQGIDLSHLPIWQAYLQGIKLPHVNFSGADLAGTVFTDTFGAVNAIAVSPDGKMIAGGTGDGEIRLWRMADGHPIATLCGHTDTVYTLSFSPDGRFFVSGGGDKTIRLWDSATWQTLITLTGHTSTIWDIIFTPDGQRLISGSLDQTIRVWDIASGRQLLCLTGHTKSVSHLAISPDSQLIISGSGDLTLRLWQANTGELCQIWHGHTGWIGPLSFTPDGRTVISTSYDKTVRFWDVATGQQRHVLYGHTGRITSFALSADGQTAASGGGDQTIHLWDVPKAQKKQVLIGHTNLVDCLAFAPDGNTLVSGGYDQTVWLWDVATGQPLRKLSGHNMAVTSVTFSPDGTMLASGGYDQKVRLWPLSANSKQYSVDSEQFVGHQNWVWQVAYSPDGSVLASASYDGTVRLWDAHTGQLCHTLHGHEAWVVALAFSTDGQTIATGSIDRTIRLWRVATGKPIREPISHTNLIWSLSISTDGHLLASGGYDEFVTVWDAQSGERLYQLDGHTGFVWSVAFGGNGRTLATGSYDHTARLWDIEKREPTHTFIGHTNWVECVAMSEDGRYIASGSHDQTIRLWDTESGQLHHCLLGHTKMVSSVAFSPDGQTLASSSGDETIKLWDVATGKCLQTLRSQLPYNGMNIADVTGLTQSQKIALKALGAVEAETASIKIP